MLEKKTHTKNLHNYEIKPKHSTDDLIIISEYKRIKRKKEIHKLREIRCPFYRIYLFTLCSCTTLISHYIPRNEFKYMHAGIACAFSILSVYNLHTYIKVYNSEGTRHMHKHMMVQCGIHRTHMCICAPPLPTHTYINFEVKAIQQTQQNTHISISI